MPVKQIESAKGCKYHEEKMNRHEFQFVYKNVPISI